MSIVLSGYRVMWVQIIFDLPVKSKKERKEANDFRKLLLDYGFSMIQFSVYQRSCGNRQKVRNLTLEIVDRLPTSGKVHILTFTDKQYGNIISFNCRSKDDRSVKEKQLELF